MVMVVSRSHDKLMDIRIVASAKGRDLITRPICREMRRLLEKRVLESNSWHLFDLPDEGTRDRGYEVGKLETSS